MHAGHAVFELGADFCGAGIIRKGEVAHKTAVGPFDAVILFAFLLLLEFAFARDGWLIFDGRISVSRPSESLVGSSRQRHYSNPIFLRLR
jgi:hypothetical protein